MYVNLTNLSIAHSCRLFVRMEEQIWRWTTATSSAMPFANASKGGIIIGTLNKIYGSCNKRYFSCGHLRIHTKYTLYYGASNSEHINNIIRMHRRRNQGYQGTIYSEYSVPICTSTNDYPVNLPNSLIHHIL